ncbi:MAG TPA: glycosyl hydrolase [Micromonosporaceae bacterium]
MRRAVTPTRTSPTGFWVALLVVLLAITGCTGPRLTPPDEPGSPGKAPLGAFLGSDHHGVAAITAFERWLGAPVAVGHTYLPGDNWSDLAGVDWVLDPWTAWRRAAPARMLVLNVPMVAPNEADLPDPDVAALLRQGADGWYDQYFRALADGLVRRGAVDTILVLGWEMNGTTYSSRCGPDPAAWRAYWRRIVAVMRAVPGQHFRFDFTPVRGRHAVPWAQCYPGDDVVDIIGMDSYDQRPGTTFADFIRQPDGLRDHAAFARAHGKPMSFPEWGLFDHGDNPAYIQAMSTWMGAHDVVYQTVTDYCPHGVWECGENLRSSEAYRAAFGRQ